MWIWASTSSHSRLTLQTHPWLINNTVNNTACVPALWARLGVIPIGTHHEFNKGSVCRDENSALPRHRIHYLPWRALPLWAHRATLFLESKYCVRKWGLVNKHRAVLSGLCRTFFQYGRNLPKLLLFPSHLLWPHRSEPQISKIVNCVILKHRNSPR